MTVHGPADGWVEGPGGQRFWGREGAAGLLAVDAGRVLLQHRVAWSHFGGTWGLPGGARDVDESAVEGALRESAEEAAVPRDALEVAFTSVLDLGFWSYTTVVARVTRPFEPVISDAESTELAWVPVDRVDQLPLHPGLAASWPLLRTQLDRRPRLVVDVANVVGSRPDGWWRDRAGATDRLLDAVEGAADEGWPARWFGLAEEGPGAPTLVRAPVTAVVEGEARAVADRSGAVLVERASAEGDATIVRVAAGAADPAADPVAVVTADRDLAERVRAVGAAVLAPSALLGLLDDRR
ncbi:NUDIX domain-containing protein [Frigoribacterium salinisoli]